MLPFCPILQKVAAKTATWHRSHQLTCLIDGQRINSRQMDRVTSLDFIAIDKSVQLTVPIFSYRSRGFTRGKKIHNIALFQSGCFQQQFVTKYYTRQDNQSSVFLNTHLPPIQVDNNSISGTLIIMKSASQPKFKEPFLS